MFYRLGCKLPFGDGPVYCRTVYHGVLAGCGGSGERGNVKGLLPTPGSILLLYKIVMTETRGQMLKRNPLGSMLKVKNTLRNVFSSSIENYEFISKKPSLATQMVLGLQCRSLE
jgi:hypothetical protein